MIFTFLLGAVASWAAPLVEDRIKGLLGTALPAAEIPLIELRVIATLCLLLVAALAAWMLGTGGNAVALALGGLIGVLGQRIYGRIRALRAPDYDS